MTKQIQKQSLYAAWHYLCAVKILTRWRCHNHDLFDAASRRLSTLARFLHALIVSTCFKHVRGQLRPHLARKARGSFTRLRQVSCEPAADALTDPSNSPWLLAASYITATAMKHKLHHALCFASLCTAVHAPQLLTFAFPGSSFSKPPFIFLRSSHARHPG